MNIELLNLVGKINNSSVTDWGGIITTMMIDIFYLLYHICDIVEFGKVVKWQHPKELSLILTQTKLKCYDVI